jgi:small subunit ribosomal protein S2
MEHLENILTTNMQYGHRPKEWNPKMARYINTHKNNKYLFDLVKTSKFLKLAGSVLKRIVLEGGKVLFVGTNKLSTPIVYKQAKKANSYYINYRWLGGMLTNWNTIQKQVLRLKELETLVYSLEFEHMPKKVQNSLKKEKNKLKRLFEGIKDMHSLPDFVIFTNKIKDNLGIQECLKLGIPFTTIVDTNCNPDTIAYPIPANDDSSSSVDYILEYLSTQVVEANKLINF